MRKKNKIFYGWFIVAFTVIIICTLLGIQFSFTVFFKPLAAEFELSRFTTSSIFSLYMLLFSIFAIVGGLILDRYGPRRIFVLGGILAGISLLITSQTNAPWQLFLTYSFLLSLGISHVPSNSMALVSRWFIKKRRLALGLSSSGVSMANIIVAPVAASLLSGFGWRTSYMIMGLAALVIVIPLSLLLRRGPEDIGALPDGDASEQNNLDDIEQGSIEQPGSTIVQTLKTPHFWLFFFIVFSMAVCLMMVMTHVVPHATDMGISTIAAASVLSFLGAFSIVSRLLIGKISNTIGINKALIVSMMVMVVSMFWLVWLRELWMFYVAAILLGLAWGGLEVGLIGMVADMFGVRNLGFTLGAVSMGFAIGAAVGPAVGGIIFDVRNSYTLAFVAAGSLMVLTALLSRLFLPKQTSINP
jgi:MFS family permease